MMNMIARFLDKFRWKWVGTVEGETLLVDEDGNTAKSGACKNSYWNLYERGDGKRRYAEIGNVYRYYNSQQCRIVKAKVDAWVYGGPLPPLYNAPTPEKPKPEGKLIVFRGGKDEAK